MEQTKDLRVAWLLPAMGTGGISFQHLLSEFTKIFPNTVAFTGQWPGYAAGFEHEFTVQEVGATRHIEFARAANGYSIGFSYASPQIVNKLLQFKPHIVFANAFSIWTVIALALKALGGWKVIITYEGGSPTYESPNLSARLVARQAMVRLADAFVVNSQSGKTYFTEILGVPAERIFARPFLVPSLKALLQCPPDSAEKPNLEAQRPVFLFVGQIVPRKGLKVLLEACVLLKQREYSNYTVRVIGEGEQRAELQRFVEQSGLAEQVEWLGKIEYRCLGAYFQSADVFVFPTYEDIWGMVLVEAMAFGQPVICSTGAGAAELVVDGQNGFLCSPGSVEQTAQSMQRFLEDATLIQTMGVCSLHIMTKHTVQAATYSFVKALEIAAE
jgi:glycosyltransferase involved in cell wall biosynthesis